MLRDPGHAVHQHFPNRSSSGVAHADLYTHRVVLAHPTDRENLTHKNVDGLRAPNIAKLKLSSSGA